MSAIPFDNSYARLPRRFYTRQNPAPVKAPALIRYNRELAVQLGIDPEWLASDEAIDIFAGNKLAEGSEPIATVYAGHQFGGFNPQLGDGRAVLLGEVAGANGQRFDIQLKGSGQTPYSRMGDGRSPLGPVLREYIVSEAMAALGIPTTRSLFAVTTGEDVYRNTVLPGAILTRVASSHIRIGHFQFFSTRGDEEAVQVLADHVIGRDYPHLKDAENPYAALLEAVVIKQAELIAQWQHIGFIHGVMNTDNMLLCGETIDYGPCAFMDDFNFNACFSSIDHGNRYAYINQPAIAHWNLVWLAQALLPLLHPEREKGVEIARGMLDRFSNHFSQAYTEGMHRKFGLNIISDASNELIDNFLQKMAEEQVDFTLTFRHLADIAQKTPKGNAIDFLLGEAFSSLLEQWKTLRSLESDIVDMHRVNPAYIPRNHLVEEAIRTAETEGRFELFHKLVSVLGSPYDYDPDNQRYTQGPKPGEEVLQTFCGT